MKLGVEALFAENAPWSWRPESPGNESAAIKKKLHATHLSTLNPRSPRALN